MIILRIKNNINKKYKISIKNFSSIFYLIFLKIINKYFIIFTFLKMFCNCILNTFFMNFIFIKMQPFFVTQIDSLNIGSLKMLIFYI